MDYHWIPPTFQTIFFSVCSPATSSSIKTKREKKKKKRKGKGRREEKDNYVPLYVQAKMTPITYSIFTRNTVLLSLIRLPTFVFSTRLFMKQVLRKRYVNCALSAKGMQASH